MKATIVNVDLNDLINQLDVEVELVKPWPRDDIDELLGLDQATKDSISKLEYTEIDDFEMGLKDIGTPQEINLSLLVGTCRDDRAGSWLELLYKIRKKCHFDRFTSVEMHNKLVNDKSAHLPEVIEIDGKYFIDLNGKHRLTIAKCLNLETAWVLVRKLR